MSLLSDPEVSGLIVSLSFGAFPEVNLVDVLKDHPWQEVYPVLSRFLIVSFALVLDLASIGILPLLRGDHLLTGGHILIADDDEEAAFVKEGDALDLADEVAALTRQVEELRARFDEKMGKD
ncbi:hypothetical protein HKX48_006577 [Thoreauomyces humboldtii]|nr:hypothetical protein HKX48_006577 [Thoreauomyces humboldtii]